MARKFLSNIVLATTPPSLSIPRRAKYSAGSSPMLVGARAHAATDGVQVSLRTSLHA
jgi:hypothetical protein